jgi:hypothetical protein
MKHRIAKIALGLSVFLFFAGFLLMCYCPGWYATCAGLAFFGVALGSARVRFWSTICLLSSLAYTVIHYELKIEDDEFFRGVRLQSQLLSKQRHRDQ